MAYWFWFRHPDVDTLLPLRAEGMTYCRAKTAAFDLLEAFLNAQSTLPTQGWGLDHADRILE